MRWGDCSITHQNIRIMYIMLNRVSNAEDKSSLEPPAKKVDRS